MRLQPIGRITPLDGVNLKPFLDNKTLCKNHSFFRLRAANTSPVRGWFFFGSRPVRPENSRNFSAGPSRSENYEICWTNIVGPGQNKSKIFIYYWSRFESVLIFSKFLGPGSVQS